MSSDGCGSHSPSLSVSGSLCPVKGTCAATSSTLHYCYSSVIKNKVFHEFLFQVCLIINTGRTDAAFTIFVVVVVGIHQTWFSLSKFDILWFFSPCFAGVRHSLFCKCRFTLIHTCTKLAANLSAWHRKHASLVCLMDFLICNFGQLSSLSMPLFVSFCSVKNNGRLTRVEQIARSLCGEVHIPPPTPNHWSYHDMQWL